MLKTKRLPMLLAGPMLVASCASQSPSQIQDVGKVVALQCPASPPPPYLPEPKSSNFQARLGAILDSLPTTPTSSPTTTDKPTASSTQTGKK